MELQLVEDEAGRPEAVDAVGLEPETLDRLRRIAPGREGWTLVFPVSPAAAREGDEPEAMVGDYVVTDGAVRFLPRVAFARGKRYQARFARGTEVLATLDFSPNRAGRESTVRAVAIYPTSDLLPVNLLRVYVEFSAPMRRGEAHRHLRLARDPGGEAVALPFPPPEAEQWNEEATRFTLILDPSRLGAAPAGESQGATGASPLEVGKRYRLVVERTWPDAEGTPIRDGLDKLFLVDEADREGGRPETWTITPPISRQAPLLVELPSPLDYALLLGGIEARRRDGTLLPGRARISNNETRWTFQPDAGWASGSYLLRIDAKIQDPSGNPAGGATGAAEQGQGERPPTVLPFEVELRPVPSTARR
jgi:hypothetical protein